MLGSTTVTAAQLGADREKAINGSAANLLAGSREIEFESGWELLMTQNEAVNWLRSSAEKVATMRYPCEYKFPGGNMEDGETAEASLHFNLIITTTTIIRRRRRFRRRLCFFFFFFFCILHASSIQLTWALPHPPPHPSPSSHPPLTSVVKDTALRELDEELLTPCGITLPPHSTVRCLPPSPPHYQLRFLLPILRCLCNVC